LDQRGIKERVAFGKWRRGFMSANQVCILEVTNLLIEIIE
jgi:hypothetical protein